MVALRCDKQRAIHEPAINIPTDLTPVKYPSPKASISTQDGSNEAKEEAVYATRDTTCSYQYIRPAKVPAALQWLRLINPLHIYIGIIVMNNDWLSDAVNDDAEL